MGNFYLASELPRGENCHILTVDVLPFWGNPSQAKQTGRCGDSPKSAKSCWGQTVWLSLRYSRVHQHQSKDSHPQGPQRPPLVLPEQQVSPQTNALQNEQNKNKMCTSQHLPACCIFVILWYTKTDAKRKGTGRGRTHPVIGMTVAVSQLIRPTCQSFTASVWGGSDGWIQIQVKD